MENKYELDDAIFYTNIDILEAREVIDVMYYYRRLIKNNYNQMLLISKCGCVKVKIVKKLTYNKWLKM